MMNQEELVAFIRKKLRSGISEQLVRKELADSGYSETEIHNAFLLAAKNDPSGRPPVTILVSILFIGMGIWAISRGITTWGIIITGWGVITLIIRLLPMIR